MDKARGDYLALLVPAPQTLPPSLMLKESVCHKVLLVGWINGASAYLQIVIPEAIQRFQPITAEIGVTFGITPIAQD